MPITPITLRIDTSAFEERMADFRENFRQYLEEREVQNEGRNENHGCEGRREGDVGHGSTGTGGLSGGEIRGAIAEWISTYSFPVCNPTVYIRGDHGEEVARFRPIGGENRDDSPNVWGISETPIGWTHLAAVRDRIYFNGYLSPPDEAEVCRRKEAQERAEALLLEHLDEGQAEDWKNDMSFDVVAQGGGTYKVDAQAQSVTNYAAGVWYCLQPDDSMIPGPDVALAHKLWLEVDEAGFLKAANCFPCMRAGIPDIVFRVEDASCQ